MSATLSLGVSEADLQAIMNKAVEQAKAGDATARAWVSDRVLGKVPSPDVQAVHDQMQEKFERFMEVFVEELALQDPEVRARLAARLAALDEEGEEDE